MRTQDFVRAAAGVLASALFAAGAVYAQEQKPEPTTMVDTAPMPATDRSSLGAVIMMDQPVLAQRQALAAAQERTSFDTRSMGAGPARILRDVMTKEELKRQRAMEAAEQQRATPN
jgi:methenyltetrahydromethanopterin cyclohydrolase